jgi:hypothetical protein
MLFEYIQDVGIAIFQMLSTFPRPYVSKNYKGLRGFLRDELVKALKERIGCFLNKTKRLAFVFPTSGCCLISPGYPVSRLRSEHAMKQFA